MKNKKWVDAGELMEQLEADPVWVAERDLMYARREQREAELRKAEASLVSELKAAGYQVESAWDLMNARVPYPAAVPILLKHLTRPYPVRVREGIARALACRHMKDVGWQKVVRLYVAETDAEMKDALAIAIAGAADEDVLEEVIELARDKRNGQSRILLLTVLRRLLSPRTKAVLMSLGTDPDLKLEVAAILKGLERKNRAKSKKKRG